MKKHFRSEIIRHFGICGFTVFCLVTLLFSLTLFSQSDPTNETIEESIFQSSLNLHQWGSISSFHGLPSENVRAIAQTTDGYLWFGTDNGLAKFDGRRVQTNLFSGVSSTRILDLRIGSDGELWIAAENGAFFFRDGTFLAVPETSGNSINSIYISNDETVFLTNGNGTVYKCLKSVGGSLDVQKILEGSLPVRAAASINGEVVIGTFNAGISKLKDGNAEPIITRPRPFFINRLDTDSNGKLWIGARSSRGSSGLFVTQNLPGLRVVGENLGTVNSIAFGSLQSAWVGTESRGAYLFEGEEFRKRFTFENTSGGLRSNKVLATFVDREGVVWFGTDNGVSRYDSRSPRNERISDDIQSNFVRTLFRTKSGIEIAGTNRGLYRYDAAAKSWITVPGLVNDTVYAISESSSGVVYIGTQRGILTINGFSGNETPPTEVVEGTIRSIEQFKGKTYFGAFREGLKKIAGEPGAPVLDSDVISLHNDSDNELWLGTIGDGVYVFDGKKAVAVPELKELNGSVVRSIAGTKNKGLWFGTDKGLYFYSDSTLEHIIPGTEVRDVIVGPDANGKPRILCATSSGLFNLTQAEYFGWISARLDVEQGLSSQNVFAALQSNDESILIGTNRGIARYEYSRIAPLVVPNRIISQRVHQSRELDSGIDLEFPQNSLSIDVAAISSRTFSEQFQYGFLLFNEEGTLVDSRLGNESQFLMENLSPGTYRVEVRAFDGDLISSEPMSFDLSVGSAPFPWIATILGILLVIALAALFWAVLSQQKIFRTSKQLTRANTELNAARLDLANEAERERRRISRDLHDQTLADLRHLLLMADEISTDKATEFRGEIENVSDEIRRICEDLSPSVLENIGFAAALEWALGNSVEQVAHEKKIETEFVCDEDLEIAIQLNRAEQIQVYRIAQEVLSNVVRHSGATYIKMSVAIPSDGTLKLSIEDNGKSFNPKESKKGRGLANIYARANLIKSSIDWKPSSRKGMNFTLRI